MKILQKLAFCRNSTSRFILFSSNLYPPFPISLRICDYSQKFLCRCLLVFSGKVYWKFSIFFCWKISKKVLKGSSNNVWYTANFCWFKYCNNIILQNRVLLLYFSISHVSYFYVLLLIICTLHSYRKSSAARYPEKLLFK